MIEQHKQQCPCKASRGIDLLAEDNGHLVGKRIADNPAKYGREHTQEGRIDIANTKLYGFGSAHHREQRDTQGIKQEERSAQLDKRSIKQPRHQDAHQNGIHHIDIPYPRHGCAAQQHIAQATTTNGGNKTHERNTKPVVLRPAHSHQHTGDGKEANTKQLKPILKLHRANLKTVQRL